MNTKSLLLCVAVIVTALQCQIVAAVPITNGFYVEDGTPHDTLQDVYWLRYTIYADDARMALEGSPVALEFDVDSYGVEYQGILQNYQRSQFHDYYTVELVNYYNRTNFRLFANNWMGQRILQFSTDINRLNDVSTYFTGQAHGVYTGEVANYGVVPEPNAMALVLVTIMLTLLHKQNASSLHD